MSSSGGKNRTPNFAIDVIPGFAGWSAQQRTTVLDLAEAGELEGGKVWARELAGGAVKVADKGRVNVFVVQRDGEHDRVVSPKPTLE